MQELVFDHDGEPWARFSDGWQLWDNGAFDVPQTETGLSLPEGGFRLFVVEGGFTTALDDAGFPYWWDNRLLADELSLPESLPIDNIVGLYRGDDNDWWVQSGSRLDHVVYSSCPEGASELPIGTAPLTTSLSVTPTVTLTATLTPIPPSELTPCLVIADTFDLPSQFDSPAAVKYANVAPDGTLELITSDGFAARLEKEEAGGYQLTTEEGLSLPQRAQINDQWPTLRQNALRLPNGRWAYDPITALRTTNQGVLMAQKPSGDMQLSTRGALRSEFELPSALDVGWLEWDRPQESFVMTSTSGLVTLSKDEFIVDNQLLFESVEAILGMSPTQLHLANQHGIWTHRSEELRLDDPNISYQPLALPLPIQAAHGRFITGGGDLLIGQNSLQPAQPFHQFSFGDVTISEEVQSRQVSGSVTLTTGNSEAFAERGFIWDWARRGLAYDNRAVQLQSDVGIHPVGQLTDFDPGPNNVARQTARLQSEASGLFLFHEGTWYLDGPTGWSVSPASPTDNRALLNNSTWSWRLQNGSLDITLAGTSDKLTPSASPDGYAFTSDRLLAATAHNNELYVATDAFLEVAAQPDELASLTAARFAPIATERLEDIRLANGTSSLFNYDGASVSRWEPIASQFVPLNNAQDPLKERSLIETPRLRFTAYPERVLKELKLDDLAGGTSWVEFEFVGGSFPFDVVTGVASLENDVYVGSAAGLQLYSGNLSTKLSDLNKLYDLRGQPTGPLMAISRLGVPKDDNQLLMARSDATCIERRAGAPFAPCSNPSLLDWRLRAESDFWQWTSAPDGSIVGQYKDSALKPVSDHITIVDGRFPHDRLDDVAVCEGRAFSMWASWITAYPDTTMQIGAGIQNYPLELEGSAPQRFICIERDMPLLGATLARGLYFEGQQERIWHFSPKGTQSGSGWTEVTNAEVNSALRGHADRVPIFDQERLRLLPPLSTETLTFEQRSKSNHWQPLPWEAGRVAIDHWRDLLFLDNRLWVATPIGLTTFERRASGQVVLDAEELVIVREPTNAAGVCEITDLRLENEENEENQEVLARCDADSSQVYQGQLDGQQESHVFQAAEGPDPFAEQELVSQEGTDYWQWQLTGREGGNPGFLVGKLREESIGLVGGRFEFDTINSLALSRPEQLDLATDASGWFQSSRESLHLRDWKRPQEVGINPTLVNGIGLTRVGEQPVLCLRKVDGDYIRLAGNQEPEESSSCPEYLGDDGLWRYSFDADLLTISAPNSIGGVGKRDLKAGRFTDDVLIGLPMTGENDNGLFYLLPTESGVLHLDDNTNALTIHVPPFAGLPDDTPPNALFMLEPQTPIYATQNALYHLDNARQSLGSLNLAAPNNATLQAIENGPQNFLRIHWRAGTQPGWTLLSRDQLTPLPPNTLPIALNTFDKFIQRRVTWNDPDPSMTLTIDPPTINASQPNAPQPHPIQIPGNLDLITPILLHDRLLLIGKQELMEINLEQAMIQVFEP